MEVYPGHVDLIHGWEVRTVLLASALWMGYVVAGASQGIMVVVCVGVWAARYWEQRNEMDGEEGGGEAALNDETTAAAVHDGERLNDENQPLLGNRG